MGEPGIKVVTEILPKLRQQQDVDLVIAQGENVSDGKGMTPTDMHRLQKVGIDFFTGGNHTIRRQELTPLLEDLNEPVIGPANMVDCPGPGWKYIDTKAGSVLVISVLGDTVGSNAPKTTNALTTIDEILQTNADTEKVATVVNFHGDYSSQKRVFGYYVDGRVSAMIGDHWHVPTADAMVLPKGTGYLSDVGMCGTLHSSLGVKTDIILHRWRDGKPERNELETKGPLQFNAVLVSVDAETGLAKSMKSIQQILPS